MQIKTRLRLNTIISLGAVVCILLAVSWSYREIVSAEQNEELTAEMHKVALERILLRDEFLLQRDQRLGAQWHAKSESLRGLIALAESRFAQGPETQPLLEGVREDFAATFAGFSQVITELAAQGPAETRATTYSEAVQERVGQVFAKAHSLVANINMLHESAEQMSARARDRGAYLVVLVVLAGMLVVIGNSLIINRTLTQRLVGLGNAVRRTGDGDFACLAVEGGNDELAVIAGEFNTMLVALAASDSERRRVAEQVLQAKNDWQATFDAISAPIMLLDKKFQIVRANLALVEKLGLRPDQVVGLTCYQAVHGCDHPQADCPHAQLLADSCRHQAEVYEDRLAGWYRISVDPLYAADGSLLGSVHYGEDISARRQVEEELRLKTARLEEAQHLAHLGSWELDLGRNQLHWSDEVYRIFGLQPQEFAVTYDDFLTKIHPEDREKVDRAYRESLEKRSGYEIEHRIVLPGGEIRYVQERGTTDFADSGKPLRSLGTVLDITERREAEEYLCLASTVIESSPTVLFRWRAAAGWPVEYVSENVAMFGYSAADLLSGKIPYSTLIHPEDLARVGEEVERYSASGVTHFAQEYRLVTATGEIRTIDDRTTVERDEAGRITHYQGIVIDITERKRLEGQLRQAQKMEAIGTLAGGIAHDFNNILTAILGFGELVMEQLEPGSPLCEDQAQVIAAGKRARDLVKQILTFSRLSEQQAQPLLIQFVVKEALKLLRASIPTSIAIREEIDVNCGAVLADPGQIHQVVMNLCTNAYQAMRESGGVLTVSLKSLMISEAEAAGRGNLPLGPYVILEVGDTGCGMSRVVRERIFEPYFTTKGTGEGTGLGLSLVHGIVTGLGGGINVYSEPGVGSTFKIYLPLTAGETTAKAEVQSEILPGGDKSILVVDDEEDIIILQRKILEGLGYRVTVFADSGEALQAFRATPDGFDLILTDMTMPGLNGDELAREILRLRPGMPIILCTGFSGLIDAEKAKGLGIREFLLKPLEKGELARAVGRALAGEVGENG